ncbi:MAG TPA: toll/interleukin-1 receptor domain-containing protein [Candidatus Angelobacter sp.]|nr:toll/interleukin-1 receptor domain-containing protein [Candidatus Angelobacter sp.]
MSYLAGFVEDVFISYAHNDDDTYAPERHGWVAQLHRDLEQRVAVHLGMKGPRVWRDCEIRNNEDFAQKISGRLAATATLLSVISPSFLEREWCLRELDEFASHAERSFGIRIDEEKLRIFKVEKVPVDRQFLPKTLQGTGSYKFHGPDPEHEGRVHEFRPWLGSDAGRYFKAMDDLAMDIASVLRAMANKTSAARLAGTPQSTATAPAVYIAETTADLDDVARDVRRDLKDRGYVVLPAEDLPYRAKEFREKVREFLKRSTLSIHLVGKEYGFIPEGESEKSSMWLQHELAAERANDPNFTRLIWMANGLRPSDSRQERFIHQLWDYSDGQKGADVQQGRFEDFKTTILETLRTMREKNEQKPVNGEMPHPVSRKRSHDEPIRIYVICDQLDRKSDHLQQLRKFLFDQKYEPFLPAEEGNAEREALQIHTDNLEICDACLVYYGAGSEKWFDAKLSDFRKILSRRQRPVLAKGVYIAPPSNESKDSLMTREAIVQRGAEQFSPESLADFLKKLREAVEQEEK